MNYFIKYCFALLSFVWSVTNLTGQTTLQVVTKKYKQEYTFNKEDYLIVRAEKGVIDIQPWQSNKVSVEVKIAVKNKDLQTAKKELEYIHWNSFRKNTVLQLYNNIVLPYNTNLESIVRVEYIIRMPQNARISIQNSFGQLKITNMTFSGEIDIQYCDLILEKTKGTFDIKSNVGDLNILDIGGKQKITTKYSAVRVNNPKGNISFESAYGSIRVNVNQDLKNLDITTQRCNVSIFNKNCMELGFNLEAKYAPIVINRTCYIREKSLLKETKSGTYPTEVYEFIYTPVKKLPNVQIQSSYGKITLD
jgi:hypothetical protein